MNALQIVSTALVLLNLAFVQVTDAVELSWLLPMYALACAAPLTVGWRERRSWRAAWNVAVLAIFGLLLHDFSTTGPRHLLEDGLTLAAFCQVHLLNALRHGQRPDLLFFNSFLIALVTSFFCQDLVYLAIFVAYALAFLVALQLGAASADHGLESGAARPLIRDGARRAAIALAVTGLVFAVWPRDFRRAGMIDDDGWLERLAGTTATGFAEEIRLGRSAHAAVDERIVLRIRPLAGLPADVPSHWRGATMGAFDRHGWRRTPGTAIGLLDALRTPWRSDGPGTWQRACAAPPTGRSLLVADAAPAGRLFAPLGAQTLDLADAVEPERVFPLADGTFRYHNGRGVIDGPLCEVSYGSEDSVGDGEGSLPDRARYLEIDRSDEAAVPPAIHALIDECRQGLAVGAPTAVLVARARDLLASRFDYLLPGEQGAASDLAGFVGGHGGGHCEFFATALAVMLRLQGIPCRLVSGYLVHEWDEERTEFVVRARDAHAWVEWWDDDAGRFVTADPTPPSSVDSDQGNGGWLDRLSLVASDWWTRLTRFDAADRAALVTSLAELPTRLGRIAAAHPPATLAVLVGLAGVLLLRRRRRARHPRVVLDYQRALRRAGLELRPGETPRELLERAQGAVRADRLAALALATASHEQSRFA